MNLTKRLRWALGCAGVFALTASAQSVNLIGDSFWGQGANDGERIDLINGWSRIGPNDASTVIDATADVSRWSFSACTTPLEGATDKMVLALNTEGDAIRRAVPVNSFGSQPLYIDMMVKFVLSDETPEISSDAQFAVFANANSNLMVWADIGGSAFTPEAFELRNSIIDPEQWYRLTITCSLPQQSSWGLEMFQVQLNGGAHLTSVGGWDETGDIADGAYFFTASDIYIYQYALNNIDFQGTGFIDELVLTYTSPDFGAGQTLFASTHPVDPMKYAAWKATYSIGSETLGMWPAYLLNVDPDDGTTVATLAILSIRQNGTDSLITLGAKDGAGATSQYAVSPSARYPIGTLRLQKSETLDSWDPAFDVDLQNPPQGVTVGSNGLITVDMAGKNFLKATIVP